MHRQTVTSKHFNSSHPLPFEQRRFGVQVIKPAELSRGYQLTWIARLGSASSERALAGTDRVLRMPCAP
jgi:hypothetical protein